MWPIAHPLLKLVIRFEDASICILPFCQPKFKQLSQATVDQLGTARTFPAAINQRRRRRRKKNKNGNKKQHNLTGFCTDNDDKNREN